MNKFLNASNENAVMALVNGDGKEQYTNLVRQYGKKRAESEMARKHSVTVTAIRAAAYYW